MKDKRSTCNSFEKYSRCSLHLLLNSMLHVSFLSGF